METLIWNVMTRNSRASQYWSDPGRLQRWQSRAGQAETPRGQELAGPSHMSAEMLPALDLSLEKVNTFCSVSSFNLKSFFL